MSFFKALRTCPNCNEEFEHETGQYTCDCPYCGYDLDNCKGGDLPNPGANSPKQKDGGVLVRKITFPYSGITLLVDKIAGWTEMSSDNMYYFHIITLSGGLIRINVGIWDMYNQIKCRERAEIEYKSMIEKLQKEFKVD